MFRLSRCWDLPRYDPGFSAEGMKNTCHETQLQGPAIILPFYESSVFSDLHFTHGKVSHWWGWKKNHMDVSDRIRPTVVGYFMRGEYVWLKFWQSNKCLKQNTYSANTFFLPDLSLTSIRKQVYQTHWISKDHVLFLFTRSEYLSFSRPMFWGKNPEEYFIYF